MGYRGWSRGFRALTKELKVDVVEGARRGGCSCYSRCRKGGLHAFAEKEMKWREGVRIRKKRVREKELKKLFNFFKYF